MSFDNSFLAQEDHPSAHEDALVFSIGEQKIGWRASGLALKRASDAGMEVGELLVDLQHLFAADLDEEALEEMSEEEVEEALEMQGGMADMMETAAKLVWLGALHFEPNARREVILSIIDSSNLGAVPLGEMLQRVFPALEDEGGSGKKPEEASES